MAVREKNIVRLDKILSNLLNDEDDPEGKELIKFVESYLQYRDAGLDFADAVETTCDDMEINFDEDDDEDEDDNGEEESEEEEK